MRLLKCLPSTYLRGAVQSTCSLYHIRKKNIFLGQWILFKNLAEITENSQVRFIKEKRNIQVTFFFSSHFLNRLQIEIRVFFLLLTSCFYSASTWSFHISILDLHICFLFNMKLLLLLYWIYSYQFQPISTMDHEHSKF